METIRNSGDYKWIALMLTTAQQLAATGAVFVFGPLAPFLIDSLQISRAQVGLFTSAIYLGYICTAIPWSMLADKIGTRAIMFISPLLQGLGYIAMSRTSSFVPAWFSMLFAGMAYSAITSVTVKTLVYWFPIRLRATAIGVKQTGAIIGGAVTAFAMPVIALAASWETAVFITGTVLATVGVLSVVLYRDHPAEPHLAGIFRRRTGAMENDVTAGRNPGRTRQVLLNRDIMLLSLVTMVYGASQFAFTSYLVLYFKEVLLCSVVVASSFLAVSQISSGAGRIAWGIVCDRFFAERRRNILVFIGLFSAAMFLVLSIPSLVRSGAVAVPLTIVMGLTTVSWLGVLLAMVSEMAGKEMSATASGVSMTVVCTGNLVGPPVFGYIVDVTGSYPLAWRITGLATFIAALLLIKVKESRKNQA